MLSDSDRGRRSPANNKKPRIPNVNANDIATMKASFERALGFFEGGDTDMAERLCRSALEDYPQDAKTRCLLGTTLVRQRRHEQAEQHLRQVIEEFPDFPKAHRELGNALLGLGRGDEAAECFRRVTELTPDRGVAFFDLSMTLSKLGREEEAREALEQSFRLEPEREELIEAAGHQRAGRFAKAEEIYRRILSRDPRNVNALRLLGAVALEMGRYRLATKMLSGAVELAPEFFGAWVDLARAFIEQDKFERGMEAIRRRDPARAERRLSPDDAGQPVVEGRPVRGGDRGLRRRAREAAGSRRQPRGPRPCTEDDRPAGRGDRQLSAQHPLAAGVRGGLLEPRQPQDLPVHGRRGRCDGALRRRRKVHGGNPGQFQLRARQGLGRPGRLRPGIRLLRARRVAAAHERALRPGADRADPRPDRHDADRGVSRAERLRTPRRGNADLHRRPAALGVNVDRADSREPQPGRRHPRIAGPRAGHPFDQPGPG